ncbi:hypothetical protein [Chromatocurvus halotolerans]|uniref:Uncharacterized protein n=1 Tax=Chromatocurvus halotolerans TaxID=1132028 RepID=A0A4V2SBC2_9GAMM|nr:hypothetical protein [Chromatocurvus halotolerans]TCO74900.1 hypothetical protein EV688_11157 [Chromatocurvus halotolerans]
MRNNFKPLGIVAAVAAVTAGYAQAQTAPTVTDTSVGSNGYGDVAIVPYYTVRDGFITGVHVVNSSDSTQVVKFRLRRGGDSMDALDWNIVMSPRDVYAGFIGKDDGDDGDIYFSTADTTCVVPAATNNRLTMPDIYKEGADEGYVEIIAMGQPVSEDQPIAVAAKHSAGVPANCEAVRSNFFRNSANGPSDPGFATRGVINNARTHQTASTGICTALDGTTVCPNAYTDSGNALKVSYFIRNLESGIEMGNSAVHLADFSGDPMMTNQQSGFEIGDMQGFNFPDLDGGSPVDLGRGLFNKLRSGDVLGVASVANEWSSNAGVNTDWVITLPGQYTMLKLPEYYQSIIDNPDFLIDSTDPDADCAINDCDWRDIPLSATFMVYDREEGGITQESGDLVVSPTPPAEFEQDILPREVNVIEWGNSPVLGSAEPRSVTTPDEPFGWARLVVESDPRKTSQRICDWPNASYDVNSPDFEPSDIMTCASVEAGGRVPMVGFTAWARSFEANPASNYGRIIEHSYVPAS